MGKRFTIAAQRISKYRRCGQLRKCSMQVAHDFEVINMLDGDALTKSLPNTNLISSFLK
jgi:phosphoribosylglycinamide formyltransferase 2